MKYIVTKTDEGEEEIFLFPNSVNHDCMIDSISHMKNQSHGSWKRIVRTPVSAGFVFNGECSGKSESLKLSSRPEDSTLLEEFEKFN